MASAEPTKSSKSNPPPEITPELEWIRFREELLGPGAYQEAPGSKMMRKIKENPFVPIGAFTTLGVLSYGLWCFRQGRARDSQIMMRARIGAQGLTVVAMMMGLVWGTSSSGNNSNTNAPAAATSTDTAKS